jgi:chloramphenicol 3-O-phosphotransferase
MSVHISTTICRYLSKYDVKTIAIIEPIEVIEQRIQQRGGRTKNIVKRHQRMRTIAAKFNSVVGTTEEIRDYLISLK